MKKILVSFLFMVTAVASFAQIDSINYPARKMPFGNWDFIWTNGALTDTVKVYPEKGGIGLDTLFFGDGTKQSTAATGGGADYLVYSAFLTQSDTTAPVATVVKNTIGSITFSYVGVGEYIIHTTDSIFKPTKFAFIQGSGNENSYTAIWAYNYGNLPFNELKLECFDLGNLDSSFQNGLLDNQFIEIRIYP